MKSFIYFLGKALQIIGMGTVFIAFLSFFSSAPMGVLLKITLVGVVEFYIGGFMVSGTGTRKNEKRGT